MVCSHLFKYNGKVFDKIVPFFEDKVLDRISKLQRLGIVVVTTMTPS